jgi:threonyl-tRNA synthetase
MSTLIHVTLPDGSQRELAAGSTGLDLATQIGPRLAKDAVGLLLNSLVVDIATPLQEGDTVSILTPKSPEALEILRHSSGHVMAQAVQRLFPNAKIAIGPVIETGFYYDFEIDDHKLVPEDLPRIEAEMQNIIHEAQCFERRSITDVPETLASFQAQGEVYKAELLSQYQDQNPTMYFCVNPQSKQDVWSDFCRGPHLPNTSFIKAFKLMSLAGAYWRGDEKNKMLQRIYATAFFDKKDLEAFLLQRAEAEKRDHRKLGKSLSLYTIEEEVGPGLVLWHPNLAIVRQELENFWRKEHQKRGYDVVFCPHIAKKDLWDISGHTQFYMENMFSLKVDDQDYILKPMNCPFHMLIYKSTLRSYRDLPLRFAELGTVYRYEKSGAVGGLTRVRGFTQDDAHLFCRPDQLKDEVKAVIQLVHDTFSLFGMTFNVELSTRPEKYVGALDNWNKAEAALKEALEDYGLNYVVNEGDGAFYGPKIDFKVNDAIGREWQCATIQMDFNLPERFELSYRDADGSLQTPVTLHRAIFGSMERFAGTLVEHYAGAFPTWLSPVQVMLLPIADRHLEQADSLKNKLLELGVRAKVDARNEGIGHKIRDAQLDKHPYMLIMGDKEIETSTVSVRDRSRGDIGAMPFEVFQNDLLKEIHSYGKLQVSKPKIEA